MEPFPWQAHPGGSGNGARDAVWGEFNKSPLKNVLSFPQETRALLSLPDPPLMPNSLPRWAQKTAPPFLLRSLSFDRICSVISPLACSSAASPPPLVLVIPTSVSFQEHSHTFLLLLLIPGILLPVIIAWSDSYSSFKAYLLQEAFFDFLGWLGSACTHSHGHLGSSPHKRHLIELRLSVDTSALSTRFGLCMSVSSAGIENMYLWSAC